MRAKTAVKAAVLIISISLFSACGELSTPLFSPGGTYQIRAMVNGNSLESCSIIRQDDKIIPYFAVSVVNDQDLTGLLVYLQNSKGDIIGEKVLYTTDPDEATQQEEENSEDNESEDTGSNGDTVGTVEENGETAKQTESELTEQVREKLSFIESKPAVKKHDIAIPIKSFEQEMPYFPMPKNLEIGPYILVFEAIGRYSTLSITESDIFYLGSVKFSLNDISMYLPELSDTSLIPVGTTVMLEAGLDFDSSLNPYVIWYNGKNVISEGSINEGAGNILWKAPEQAGFYSLRLEVLPYKIKGNFTGIFREITLPVSTKASHTGYFFGNGPDYTAIRPLAAGTAYPEQLQLTQAAAKAAASTAASAVSLTKKSDKSPAPTPPPPPELLRWYRFEGSLDDKSMTPERMFEAANEKAPRWAAVGQSFGLSTGPDDVYLLRPISFLRPGQDQGGGIFLLHVRPAAEDTVFNVFFPLLASEKDGVWMDMALRKNAAVLRLKTNGTTVEIPVNFDYSGLRGLIPIVVEFYIRPYRFEAKLSLGEDSSIQSMTGEIRLPGVLSGESRIKLGEAAPLKKTSGKTDESQAETEEETIVETVQPASVTTVWDEFAVLYSTTPLLPEEILVEENSEPQEMSNKETAPQKTQPAAKTETRQEAVTKLPTAAKEETKPSPANTNAALETEAPLADIQTENTQTEQTPAAETRQGSEAETADDEEARLLISIQ